MASKVSEVILQSPLAIMASPMSRANIQWVLPVQLNGDGMTDFIVNYWQAAPSPGFVLTDPTRDALFAFVSQPDGSYKVDNLGVFGVADPKLGGASRKVDRGDINGDGVDDFAFAMNSEDGRAAEDVNTNEARPVILLSQSGGKYSIVNLGEAAWGHSVTQIDNGLGSKDILFAGYTNPGLQAFRYANGAFSDVTSQYSAASQGWATAVKSVPGTSPSAASAYLIGTDTQGETVNGQYRITKNGLALYAKSGSGWSIVDAFYNEAVFSTPWISWQRAENVGVSVYKIDGKYYFHGTFDEILVSNELNADGSITVIGKMMLGRYTNSDTIVQGQKYDEQDVQPENHLRIFKLKDGHLIEQPGAIIGQKVDINFNDFYLTDINGDGAKDIVVQAMTRPWVPSLTPNAGKPIIYINDGTGTYHYADIEAFPKNRDGDPPGPELWGYFHDVDGDGFADLVTWQSGVAEGGSNVQINFLKERPGIANSNADDTLFGTIGADQFSAGGGNDTIDGGAGLDRAIFKDSYSDVSISVDNGVIVVATKTEGVDRLTSIETLTFKDQTISATSILRDYGPAQYRLQASDGFVGTLGGAGSVLGTKGKQDISLASITGSVTFDASFNAGGDVLRLPGKASDYTIARSGSSARILSESLSIIVPIGTKGMDISFDDGARQLIYAQGSFKLGSQSFSSEPSVISAPAQAQLAAQDVSLATSAKVILYPNASMTAGGAATIIGTKAGQEIVTLTGGKIVFDASFNAGGDRINVPGLAKDYLATRSGSSVILTKGADEYRIPIGTKGMDIAFGDDVRTLVFANGAFMLGTQAVTTNTVLIG